MIDPRLKKDVQAAERCKLVAYLDTQGYWTIGWGHELADQTRSWKGTVWSQAQADAQLDQDLESAQGFAQSTPEWGCLDTDCRRNAVTELCFNMRKRWLLFVKCRAAIRAHDWLLTQKRLLMSLWESQVHVTRAERIAGYLLTGEYPT